MTSGHHSDQTMSAARLVLCSVPVMAAETWGTMNPPAIKRRKTMRAKIGRPGDRNGDAASRSRSLIFRRFGLMNLPCTSFESASRAASRKPSDRLGW
jgi:hypothetical protein